MALQFNGGLLLRHPSQVRQVHHFSPPSLDGYVLSPLMDGNPQAQKLRSLTPWATETGSWQQALPVGPVYYSAWDAAHNAAAQWDYGTYFEPDVLHTLQPPTPASPNKGMDTHWPPFQGASPGWHRGPDFSGFDVANQMAKGKGIRIGHIDTGYNPRHVTLPRGLNPSLAWDAETNKNTAVNPLPDVPLLQTGHGTGTLALLAGGTVNWQYEGQTYSGDLGGAPDAEVIPVRVGPSVIHFCTSNLTKGLLYCLAPGGEQACDVISLSHGGLASAALADAVNRLYDAGTILVAASGDVVRFGPVEVPPHFTVYPSAFRRVITAVGVTYDGQPYYDPSIPGIQGSWGPDSVMAKAVAAPTPNVAWADAFGGPNDFAMNGSGTSSATPQIAAACALWLELYGKTLPHDWRRVEACRNALFDSSSLAPKVDPKLGWGRLRVPEFLDAGLAASAIKRAAQMEPTRRDQAYFPALTILFGWDQPEGVKQEMHATEATQILGQSTNQELLRAVHEATSGADREFIRSRMLREPLSQSLRQRLAG